MDEKEKTPENKSLDDDGLLEVRESLSKIEKTMPAIWKLITESNCCPHNVGLKDNCGFDKDCADCWREAMANTISPKVVVSNQHKYVCFTCKQELQFLQVTLNARQIWQCPTCKTCYEISVDDSGLLRVGVVPHPGPSA